MEEIDIELPELTLLRKLCVYEDCCQNVDPSSKEEPIEDEFTLEDDCR